ncbi:MAG TPA: hypothetical protein VMA31_02810 [Bryobacteraceae bacterium]|nr:hypothetical protein [Bryobacteraceae bacterium]
MTRKVEEARIHHMEVCGRRPVLLQLRTDNGIVGVCEAAVAYGAALMGTNSIL